MRHAGTKRGHRDVRGASYPWFDVATGAVDRVALVRHVGGSGDEDWVNELPSVLQRASLVDLARLDAQARRRVG